MNTRLPDLLHDLASEMPTETRSPAHHTLRRARIRRAAVVAFTAVTAVAVVLGTIGGLRALSSSEPNGRPIVPATEAPAPPPAASFQGLWPETDAEALAEMQAQVDAGHMPLRADPEGTAMLLAVNLLGWEPEAVHTTFVERGTPDTIVELRNTTFGEDTPPITVVLGQLAQPGENGVWSVVRVSSPLIDTIGTAVPDEIDEDSTISFDGAVTDQDGEYALRFEVLAGPVSISAGGDLVTIDGNRFEGSWTVEAADPTTAVMWFFVVDPTDPNVVFGATAVSIFAAEAIPVPTPTETPSPDFTALPPDVAVTAQRIYDGALARDFDALAELLDPNTFVFNFDDGSDPIPAWREEPSVLDLAAAILQLPAAEPREIEGYGTFYLWPYLIDSDFANLSDQERADLAFLGYSGEEIQLMIDGGYGYQGPRLGIDADGLWRNFTTVGE